jgi:hypothetical protein
MERISGVAPPPFGEDQETLEIFRSGNSAGTFQFGSSGIRQLATRLNIERGEDLAAAIALHRPGPLNAGADVLYAENRAPSYHSEVDKVLAQTRGVLLYQETVMRLFSLVAGVTFAESDKLRKLISKKRTDDPAWPKLHEMFITGGLKMGMSEKVVKELWKSIFAQAGYSFPLAHAISYAHLSYRTPDPQIRKVLLRAAMVCSGARIFFFFQTYPILAQLKVLQRPRLKHMLLLKFHAMILLFLVLNLLMKVWET